MLWDLECRIKPKEKYVRISMKKIWRNLDSPPKNKELWSYAVKFEFSRPKSSSSEWTETMFVSQLRQNDNIIRED